MAFKDTMDKLGIEMPRSKTVNTVEDAEEVAEELGYPVSSARPIPWAEPAAVLSIILKN